MAIPSVRTRSLVRMNGLDLSPRLRNNDGVAGLEIDRLSLTFQGVLIVELHRLLRTIGSLTQDADVLGMGEILEPAGHRERLNRRDLPLDRKCSRRVHF